MEKKVRLGSILKVREKLGLVIGFQNVKYAEQMKVCCMVVPYPYGYISEDYIKRIPVEEAEILEEGYRSGFSSIVEEYIERASECFRHLSAEEAEKALLKE